MCERFSGYVSYDGSTVFPGDFYSHSACEEIHSLSGRLHSFYPPKPFEWTKASLCVRCLYYPDSQRLEAALLRRFKNHDGYEAWAKQHVDLWVLELDNLIQQRIPRARWRGPDPKIKVPDYWHVYSSGDEAHNVLCDAGGTIVSHDLSNRVHSTASWLNMARLYSISGAAYQVNSALAACQGTTDAAPCLIMLAAVIVAGDSYNIPAHDSGLPNRSVIEDMWHAWEMGYRVSGYCDGHLYMCPLGRISNV